MQASAQGPARGALALMRRHRDGHRRRHRPARRCALRVVRAARGEHCGVRLTWNVNMARRRGSLKNWRSRQSCCPRRSSTFSSGRKGRRSWGGGQQERRRGERPGWWGAAPAALAPGCQGRTLRSGPVSAPQAERSAGSRPSHAAALRTRLQPARVGQLLEVSVNEVGHPHAQVHARHAQEAPAAVTTKPGCGRQRVGPGLAGPGQASLQACRACAWRWPQPAPMHTPAQQPTGARACSPRPRRAPRPPAAPPSPPRRSAGPGGCRRCCRRFRQTRRGRLRAARGPGARPGLPARCPAPQRPPDTCARRRERRCDDHSTERDVFCVCVCVKNVLATAPHTHTRMPPACSLGREEQQGGPGVKPEVAFRHRHGGRLHAAAHFCILLQHLQAAAGAH